MNISGAYLEHIKVMKTHYLHDCSYRVNIETFMEQFNLVFEESFSYVKLLDWWDGFVDDVDIDNERQR